MLDEREPWLEHRSTFKALYVVLDLAVVYYANGVTYTPVCYPLSGAGFDLIVVPRDVQRSHKDWVDSLTTRLLPRGRLVIVDKL